MPDEKTGDLRERLEVELAGIRAQSDWKRNHNQAHEADGMNIAANRIDSVLNPKPSE